MKQNLTARELRPVTVSLCKKGNYQDASKIVISFIEVGYVDFEAASMCMEAARNQNDAPQMAEISNAAVKIAPKNWKSWQLRYQAQHADSLWQDALYSLQRIAKLTDNLNSEHYLAKAETYLRLLQHEKALEQLEAVEGLNEGSSESRYHLLKATIYFQQKKIDEVLSELPDWLEKASPDQYVSGAWKILGRCFDNLGLYDQAFSALEKGNSMRASIEGRRVSDNTIRRRVEIFRTIFVPEWVEKWSHVESPRNTPVFMLGFPRSGTTLLEQIVDSHHGVQAMEEPPTMSTVLRQATALMQGRAMVDGKLRQCSSWKSQWLTVMDYIKDLTQEQVGSLRKTYFQVAEKEVQLDAAKLLVEKMPLDTVDIGLILRLFPDARFVVSLRHPADCILSGYMQSFKMNDGMANFLDLDNAASFYKHVMKLLWQYEDVFDLKDRMHYVRYEDLVMDLEGEARKVLDFMGLHWDSDVLNYDEHAKRRGTLATPSYQGVTQKIYSTSKGRWRNYAKWMEPVLPHFREAAERYGYDLSP